MDWNLYYKCHLTKRAAEPRPPHFPTRYQDIVSKHDTMESISGHAHTPQMHFSSADGLHADFHLLSLTQFKTRNMAITLFHWAAKRDLPLLQEAGPEGTPNGTHWTVAGSDHYTWSICSTFILGPAPLDQALVAMLPDSGGQRE